MKSKIIAIICFAIFIVAIAIFTLIDNNRRQEAIEEFPTAEVNAIAETYGVNDFTYYTVNAVSGNYVVRIKSNEFENLSNEEKFELLLKLDTRSYYYGSSGIICGEDEYRLSWGEDELCKNNKVIYTSPKQESSYSGSSSGSSSRKTCSSCGGSGKKVVTWYEYGDWGETSYSTYDCTKCNGKGYTY